MSELTDAPVPPPISTERPPEYIPLVGGVSLRRRRAEDAVQLNLAVNESLDHLRPWMPWAQEAPSLEQTRELSRSGEGVWEAGTDFIYVVGLDSEPGSVIGAFGVHGRIGPGAVEIGYWVHRDHVGHGIATAGAGALTEAALALPGIDRVEIHCDEGNTSSAAVPRKLGYRLDRTEDAEIKAPSETGRHQIWILER